MGDGKMHMANLPAEPMPPHAQAECLRMAYDRAMRLHNELCTADWSNALRRRDQKAIARATDEVLRIANLIYHGKGAS
jgi:hypothetical protein